MFLILIIISGEFPIIVARYRVGPIAAVPCKYSLGLCDYVKNSVSYITFSFTYQS